MIKSAINKFLVWLNTPRCIEIPVFGESKDYKLYDDLYKQKETLERRKQRLIERAGALFVQQFYMQHGYLPSEEVVKLNAVNMYWESKQAGNINEFNELVRNDEAA